MNSLSLYKINTTEEVVLILIFFQEQYSVYTL